MAIAVTTSLGVSSAHASSMRASEPLVELLAHGEPVPGTILVLNADKTRYAHREPTEREATLLRNLGHAHAQDDAAAFQAALDSGLPIVVEYAIEGLAYGRLSSGEEGRGQPLIACRATDAAFVARFLPTLARLAREPVGTERSVYSTVPERAAGCLGLLARGTRRAEVRRQAIDALVDGIVAQPLPESIDALGRYVTGEGLIPRPYGSDEGMRFERIPLAPEHQRALVPVVESFLVAGLPPPGPIFLSDVLAALDAEDVDRLYAKAKAAGLEGEVWEDLIQIGHAGAVSDMTALAARQLGSRPGRPGDAVGLIGILDRNAMRFASHELAPVLEGRLARLATFEWDAAKSLSQALESVGAKDALVRELDRQLVRPEGPFLWTAEAAARMDAPTAARLRAMLPTLPDGRRVLLLRALIRAGIGGLEPRAAALAQPTADPNTRWAAILALGDQVRVTRSRTALTALEHLWSTRLPVRDIAFPTTLDPMAEKILEAIRVGGWMPPETERMLIASLREIWTSPESTAARRWLVETLGALGGAEARAAIEPLCAVVTTERRRDRRELRVECRAAVGAIEARLLGR